MKMNKSWIFYKIWKNYQGY